MHKNFLLIFFVFIFLETNAQNSDVVKARIEGGTTQVSIVPEENILYATRIYKFKIKFSGKQKISRATFNGGKIKFSDSDVTVIVNEHSKLAVLNVYQKTAKGEKLCLLRKYGVITLMNPIFYLNDVKQDSAIEQLQLMANGTLVSAIIPGVNTSQSIVKSFDMIFINDSNKFDTLHSATNLVSKEMQNRIRKMKPGNTLDFYNIKLYIDKLKKEKTFKYFRVFLMRSKIRSFGG